ncbi:MAG: hypothetical protein IJB32_05355, partial [Clostridia bacterium]|nr:hypothetical protein [Clostridia bacterium]
MRKILITVFSLLIVMLLGIGVACTKDDNSNNSGEQQQPTQQVKLVDFDDIAVSADYNSTFDISEYLIVKDEDGKDYTATATLYDGRFKEVELTGNSFSLNQLKYILKLKVKLSDGNIATRRVDISAIDYSPYDIQFSVKGLPTWGINNQFVLPTAIGVRE